jgi:hypothetical protein
MRVYATGPHCAVAEPVFVPRNGGTREGEGYLLTNIFDEDRNASHFAIFDAEQIERGPNRAGASRPSCAGGIPRPIYPVHTPFREGERSGALLHDGSKDQV